MKMYDLNGVLQWSVGGAALGDTVTSNVGVLLGGPSGVQFSQDGTYVLLAEGYSMRITKWSTATGAYLGSVGSGYRSPYDVTECWMGTGVGTVVSDYSNARFAVVSETGVVTTSTTALLYNPTAIELVPGVGVMVAAQGSNQIMVLSSVAIATHPVNATTITPSTATFTIALTANSATTGLTYVWTKGGVVVGTNSASYTYTATGADVDAGPTYPIVCTVIHAMGSATSMAATLTVVRGVTVAPISTSAAVGGASVTFTATPASGNTVTTYAWTLGGVAVGTNSATYTYTAVEADAGPRSVVCTVTASKGVAASNTASLTVQVSPCSALLALL
jgi:hypothetical protein